MRKSFSNRIRITKKGKIMRRAMAQGHFLAKKRSTQLKRKKKQRGLTGAGKMIRKYL